MQAGGKDNLFIMTVTEHKQVYGYCLKLCKITTETVTTSQVTKTVSRTSIQLQTGHRAGGQAVNGPNTGVPSRVAGGPNRDAGGPNRDAGGCNRDAGGRKAILHIIAEQG